MNSPSVIELSATSTESFEDAYRVGLARASRTVRDIRGAWVKEQQMDIAHGQVQAYRVNLQVTFGRPE